MNTPETPEAKRYENARGQVELAVRRVINEEAPEAYEVREIYPGAGDLWRRQLPLPRNHVQAARAVLQAARAEERRAIEDARGSGVAWAELGQLLGLDKAAERAEMTVALAAWRYAAMGVLPDERDPESAYSSWRSPVARWRCWTCTGSVREAHPDNGVRDAEEGHKDGCTRYAAEVAAQEQTWSN